MVERSQSFNVNDKSYSEIQTIMENILEKELSLSIKTKKLGRSLLRIVYFDKDTNQEEQKNNRITILQEPEKRVYIQIKGKLTDTQIRQLWIDFQKKLINSSYSKKFEKFTTPKEEIIQKIKNSIELKGYVVKDNDVQTFIENFIEKYNRFPNENELHSIVEGYILMMNENLAVEKTAHSIKSEQPIEMDESVLDIIDDKDPSSSYHNSVTVFEDSIERRKCPSCGDETSIHEVIDKSIILMAYPRIYGKKKYCGLCGFEWK
ncbi:MAG: hypothetical protein ACFFA4_04115 [Promethearchaeota archaeon]